MPYYEVFIPAKPGTDNESVTVEVEASSWLLALRSGMHTIGEQGEALSSIMCENRPDGTVVVKDPTSRRMFRIREIQPGEMGGEAAPPMDETEARRLREEAEAAVREREAAQKRLEESIAKQKEAEERARQEHELARKQEEERVKREAEEQKAKEQAERKAKEEAAQRAKIEAERKAAEEKAAEEAERKAAEEKARKEAEEFQKKQEKVKAEQERKQRERIAWAALEAARERKEAEEMFKASEDKAKSTSMAAAAVAEGISREIKVTRAHIDQAELEKEIGPEETIAEPFDVDEVLADLFMEMMDVTMMDEKRASEYTLDLAMRTINAEAGSVILSDYNSALQDLYFVAAHGRVADQLADIRIPRGKGIVGFSVQMGCPLSVSDVSENPNFYKDVEEKTGFATRSILCVPVQHGPRTFGAIELVNKKGTDRWTPGEMNVSRFLAQKLGEHLFSIADKVSLDLK